MEHFYNSIEGWFDYPGIYNDMIAAAPNNAHFVEVGSYKGRSAAYMLVEIINSGKQIKLDCVDIGYQPEVHQNLMSVNEYYTHRQLPSVDASVEYEANSLDFVWIDGDHSYEAVINDINAWLPKVKPGGWIGGHDYNHPMHEGVKQACCELIPDHKEIEPSFTGEPHGHVTSWLWQKPT